MPAMAYDSARGRTVLFGGWNGAEFGDTWEWDGTTWQQLSPASPPAARDGAAMAYDSERQRVVLFGGWDASANSLMDTCLWDGVTWSCSTPAGPPAARHGAAAAWSAPMHAVLLFGGQGQGASGTPGPLLNDVWLWNGTGWSQAPATSPAPTARLSPGMIFDPVHGGGELVLLGGASDWQMSTTYGDLWVGTPSAWSELDTSGLTYPGARGAPGFVFDTKNGVGIFFGGAVSSFANANDTWAWDGASWTQLTPSTSPPARGQMGMVWDSGRATVVLFGGTDANLLTPTYYGDTWELAR